jgi:hypothetical protein
LTDNLQDRKVRLAQTYKAKGVALDFYFEDGQEDKRVDELLCSAIDEARKLDNPIPVFVAYDYELKNYRIDQLSIDPDLKACLPEPSQGHAIGYAEWDGKVRSIPLYFRHQLSLESLSLKVAKSLDSQVKVPDNGLLQFTKPEIDFPTINFDELEQGSDKERAILRTDSFSLGKIRRRIAFQHLMAFCRELSYTHMLFILSGRIASYIGACGGLV